MWPRRTKRWTQEGHFVRNSVSGRYREETQEYPKSNVRLHGRIPQEWYSLWLRP